MSSAGLKYGLARLGLFVACAVPLVLLLPQSVDLLLKFMIALVISAAISFFLLRGLRDRVTASLVASRTRKHTERERLRSALAGDEDAHTDPS